MPTNADATTGVTGDRSQAASSATLTRPIMTADLVRLLMRAGIRYGTSIDTECNRNTGIKRYTGVMANCSVSKRANPADARSVIHRRSPCPSAVRPAGPWEDRVFQISEGRRGV